MSYQATVYKVMIASPGDVRPERLIVREVLTEWNTVNADSKRIILLPIAWETHASPSMGDRPQSIINKQILKDCDLLVGVFWTRLGTPTGEYPSGTVEEIEEHLKAGKPVMLYFSDAPVRPDSVNAEEYAELKNFKEACKSRGLLEMYTDLNEFKAKFYRQLQINLNNDDFFKHATAYHDESPSEVVVSRLPDIPKLSREAQVLLKEASQDSAGDIIRLLTLGGFNVQTNGKQMVEDKSARNEAIWEAAIEELEKAGLIVDRGYKREIFRVTREGYELAELLNP